MTDFNLLFNYKGSDILIQGNINNYMKEIFQKYSFKSDIKLEDVYFTLNGEKINGEKKLGELNIEGQEIRIKVHQNNEIVNYSLKFNYKGAELMIQGNSNDYMKDLFKKYSFKSDIKLEDVNFSLNGEKINGEKKLGELNIKGQEIRIQVYPNIEIVNYSLKFTYKGAEIAIQGNSNDYMKDLFKKYVFKSNLKLEDIYFTLNGKKINEEKKLIELNISEPNVRIVVNEKKGNEEENNYEEDKENTKEVIMDNIYLDDNFPVSKDIICPTCGDFCILNIDDFKLKLNQCHNNHEIPNIMLTQFKKTQKFDDSKIFCKECKEAKEEKKSEFWKCINCNIYLCNTCKIDKHEKNQKYKDHKTVNYEALNFVCHTHGEKNIFYCPECHENICDLCAYDHDEKHELIYLRQVFEDRNIEKNFNDFISKLDGCKKEIQSLISILKQVYINIDAYYNICNNIIKRYDIKHKNYQLVMSLNNLNKFNQSISSEIDTILNDSKIENKFKVLYEMSKKMNISKQLSIKYKIGKKKKIRIFGDEFVKNNKDNAKIIFDDKEYDLNSLFDLRDIKIQNNFLEIKLKEINTITDLSYMFNECSSLISLPEESILNNSNITNLKYLFNKCLSLEKLPDLSKMKTNNVEDISYMFNNCSSLKILPDISTWITDKVTNMKSLFSNCSSLLSIPDISKWNISNVTDISDMFSKCSSLTYIPDISIWNTSNVINKSNMFLECKSLEEPPDCSEWDKNNDIKGN